MLMFRSLSQIKVAYLIAVTAIMILTLVHFVIHNQILEAYHQADYVADLLDEQRYRLMHIILPEMSDAEILILTEQMRVLLLQNPEIDPAARQQIEQFLINPQTVKETAPVLAYELTVLGDRYRRESTDLRGVSRDIEWIILGLTFLTLGGLVFGVFRPMEAQIQAEQQKLVAQQKQIEEAYNESQHRLRTIVQHISEGTVAMFDRNFRYTMVEKLGITQIGMTAAELEGKTIYEVVPPEVLPEIEQNCIDTFAGKETAVERSYNNRWFFVRSKPLRDTQGNVVAGLVITQDITVRKLAEESLIEQEKLKIALQKEQELSQLKTKMMVRISHEFRTPLSIIQTSTELLTRYHHRIEEDQRRQHMEMIRSSIRNITKILEQIALLVKGKIQQDKTLFSEIRLYDVCQEVVRSLQPDFPDHQFILSGDPITLHFDRALLSLLVNHLVSNAAKYSPKREKIWLELKSDDDHVKLSIRDEGIGISSEDQPHIFDLFYRGSNISEIPGIGVGLNIVKDIVDLLDGEIQVDSTIGHGTTVTLSFKR